MQENKPTLMDWLGISSPPDYSKSRWLGGLTTVIFILICLSLFLPTLFHFFTAAWGIDESIPSTERHEAIRNIGLAVAAFVGVPFLIWRSVVAQKQVDIAHQGLTTDRINKAVGGLGAEKTVHEILEIPRYRKKDKKWVHDKSGNLVPATRPDGNEIIDREHLEYSAPNIEVRIGAIYALERIAQEELSFHIQIMEILCAYIRHNAPASLASDDLDNLTEPRDDIRAAITAIGRRNDTQIALERTAKTPNGDGYRLDLRKTCLQVLEMSKLNFSQALFQNAMLQKTKLWSADLQGVYLWSAQLQMTDLKRANLQGADLRQADLKGAKLWHSDVSNIYNPNQLVGAFGDGSVTLPDGYTAGEGDLAHWSREKLQIGEYLNQLRTYQESIGLDPDEP